MFHIIYSINIFYTLINTKPAHPTVSNVSFQVHTVSKTITPYTLDIENINAKNKVLIYPNPTTGLINIASSLTAHALISDVVGHKVYETNINSGNTQLNLSNLNEGIYFINIKSADLNYSNKIIIHP